VWSELEERRGMIHPALFIPKERLKKAPEHKLSFQTTLTAKYSP